MDNADAHEGRKVAYGLATRCGDSAAMARAHRRDGIEPEAVESGAVRFRFGGTYVGAARGQR